MKKVILPIFLLLLGVFIVELGYYLKLKNDAQNTILLSSQDEVRIRDAFNANNVTYLVSSDYKDITLEAKNKERLGNYLNELGIAEKIALTGLINFEDGEIIIPKKVLILLTSQEQTFLKLIANDGEQDIEVRSYGSEINNDQDLYVLKIYINEDILRSDDEAINQELLTTSYILEGLYYGANLRADKTDFNEELVEIEKRVFEDNLDLFELEFLNKTVNLILDFFSTDIKAQTCTGSAKGCYTRVATLACSEPGGSCAGLILGSPCYSWLTKSWGSCYYPVPAPCIGFFPRECSVISGQCKTADCPPGTCKIDPPGNCYWTCSCGAWIDGACGGGTCTATQRRQTRDCNPDGCSSESRCVADGACTAPPPSCTVSLDPASASIAINSDFTYTASVIIGSGTVDQVNFSSNDTDIATVNPASDSSTPYQTLASGVDVGSAIITADVVMSGAVTCSDTANLEVTNPGPWWQVIDSDIVTNGDIISSIPLSCALPGCNPLLGLEGLGGFPGIPIYGGSLDTDAGGVSSTNWMANAESVFSKVYDYEYFSRLVRPDVTLTEIDSPSVNGGFFTSGGAPSRGYVWYHFDGDTYGDLVVNSSVNMPGSRKVVVLVENADLYIQDRINVVDGVGYIMFIVGKDDTGGKGNIYVDPGVSHPSAIEIEGVFFAEGEFRTGAGNNQLHIRGMLAAMDGVVLERDLEGGNVDEPAEVFEYAPDFVLTFPRDLTFKRLKWKEVAP